MPYRKYPVLLAVVALTFASACGDCIAIGISPLIVTVSDDRTGQSVLPGATVIAVSGALRDSMIVPASFAPTSIHLACCSGGTFTVIVKRPGYLDATRDNIRVEEGRCGHPKPETVHIRLTPMPTG